MHEIPKRGVKGESGKQLGVYNYCFEGLDGQDTHYSVALHSRGLCKTSMQDTASNLIQT